MSFSTKKNHILDEKGRVLRLKGVSRTGLEYAYVDLDAMIPETIEFDIQTMKQWGFNAIRFPIRDRFWLEDMGYREKIEYWVDQTLQNQMIAVLDLHTQQDHAGQDPFMIRTDTGVDALSLWTELAKTYHDTPHVFFEIFNEPHDIPPSVWWEGNGTYYGYKEVLLAVRKHAKNICLIGGLDYAYQFQFLRENHTLLKEVRSTPNLALSVHPYGYKGTPVQNGTATMQIPTTLVDNPENHTGDCHLGITVPSVPPSEYGWDESFGFLVREGLLPVVATEWGLDKPDNCIQGGWYNVQILDYLDTLGVSYMAWAWVQDRLDYPSLLGKDFQPTGKADKDTTGPACSGPSNNFYPGPGVLVQNDLRTTPRQLWSATTTATTTPYDCPVFRNLACLSLLLVFVLGMIGLFPVTQHRPQRPGREPEVHKVLSNTKLHHSIRVRSSHSLSQLK
jgi:hypothetical protein